MSSSHKRHRPLWNLVIGAALVVCVGATGCQVYTGGQTLPSPDYVHDDVQYHAPGAEFKLANEAAAAKAHRQETTAEPVQR